MPRTYPFAESIIASAEQIEEAIGKVARQLKADYGDKVTVAMPLVLVCVLKGSYLFAADLARALSDVQLPNLIEFICVSSYGGGTRTTGEVRMLLDLRNSIVNRHVLFVEDIIDSGRTLHFLMNIYNTRSPASLKAITLLDKPMTRQVKLEADYRCFFIPNAFVVGYGLDYNEQYRDLRDIVVLKKEVYSKEEADKPHTLAPTDNTLPVTTVAAYKSKL